MDSSDSGLSPAALQYKLSPGHYLGPILVSAPVLDALGDGSWSDSEGRRAHAFRSYDRSLVVALSLAGCIHARYLPLRRSRRLCGDVLVSPWRVKQHRWRTQDSETDREASAFSFFLPCVCPHRRFFGDSSVKFKVLVIVLLMINT
jgi:hypothetical protein